MAALSDQNWDAGRHPCFLGAGAYNHFVPSVVKHIVSRGEFYTAYTPYQPEVSQGTLQATFEYQSMICDLTGMDVANASHYDGATALAEALILALSAHRGQRRRVVMSRYGPSAVPADGAHLHSGRAASPSSATTHPVVSLGDLAATDRRRYRLRRHPGARLPGRHSRIAELPAAVRCRPCRGALLVVSANPISLGLLQPPAEYGADVVVGEGQPLGNALAFGGPYLGFFATRTAHVRRMAGRLVGMTLRRRWQARLRADALDARTAHPPREAPPPTSAPTRP